jgi:hypothetical protein
MMYVERYGKKERGMSTNFTGFIVSAYSNFGVDQTYYQSGHETSRFTPTSPIS